MNTTTAAQRHNARQDKIWQACKEAKATQAQHSPLPWVHTHEDGCINDATGGLIASEIRYDEGKLIVASVNHAEALAEACRAALILLNAQGPRQNKVIANCGNLSGDVSKRIREALARWEAK